MFVGGWMFSAGFWRDRWVACLDMCQRLAEVARPPWGPRRNSICMDRQREHNFSLHGRLRGDSHWDGKAGKEGVALLLPLEWGAPR